MKGARRIEIRCSYSLGDIIALSGAIREIQEQYPGEFALSAATTYPEVWQFNPHLCGFTQGEQVIDCNQVRIDRNGERNSHYIQSYLDLLNHELGTNAVLRKIGGDIHLSEQERNWYSEIYNFCGEEIPYWIICSGGKFDVPIKWWDHERYQEVVDHFAGRMLFVQVGAWGNQHPRLRGTIDLRGRTKIRDLIHLVYYAKGVLCGVTSLMHLAAAVPTENGSTRDAAIIAGLREPRVWEAYPGHSYFTPAQQLECAHCWKQRYFPIPDRGGNRDPKLFCDKIGKRLPACMEAITARDVIQAFEAKFVSGSILTKEQVRKAIGAVHISEQRSHFDEHNITPLNARQKAEEFLLNVPKYRRRSYSGRGIVICGGGASYFTNSWVNIRILRMHDCGLPIELWYLGRKELDHQMECLLAAYNVRCVNAREVMNRYPFRNPLGWELKSYAILHSSFAEVLFLDADNIATSNPEYLFKCREYLETGAVFWPDFKRLSRRRPIWKLCGVRYKNEQEFESGQILVNKEKCWPSLNLAFWYNDHSEFFYQYIHGDKETFHMAWRKTQLRYAMPPYPIHPLTGTMCQHDFSGNIIFQHRNLRKWKLFGVNQRINGFQFEDECLEFLEELRRKWDGRIGGKRETILKNGFRLRKGTCDEQVFENVCWLNEYQLPRSFAPNDIIIDVGGHIGSFSRACHERGSRRIYCYEADRENAALAKKNLRVLNGIKVFNEAILHRNCRVESEPYPIDERGLNPGGAVIRVAADGGTKATSLDRILKKFKGVKLLKLDCEGSEWPILRDSKELHRVESICGEYHEMDKHELCGGAERLDRSYVRKLLRKNFASVKTMLDKENPRLGKFWASIPKRVNPIERQLSHSWDRRILAKKASALRGARSNRGT